MLLLLLYYFVAGSFLCFTFMRVSVCCPLQSVFRSSCLSLFPDPRALNSCMRSCPEKKGNWNYHVLTHDSMCLDVGFETLKLLLCKLKL